MATSSLHPHSSNPFRDPNRTGPLTPQATGTSTHTLNPFLSPNERVSPQATGGSQYFTPQQTGAGAGGLAPQATGALNWQPTGDFTPQGTGSLAPQATGAFTPQATGALAFSSPHAPISTQNTGSHSAPASPMPSAAFVVPAEPPSPISPIPSASYAPPPGPPPQPTYAPPPGPPPAPRRSPSPTPTVTLSEPPPPYTPAADVRGGEIPLETGPRRAYAPAWHPDGQAWRNPQALSPREEAQPEPSVRIVPQPTGASSSGFGSGSAAWSGYPGRSAPPRHPTASTSTGSGLGRANTTASSSSSVRERAQPGPPTSVPTPGRALLNGGRVLAYPAGYECDRCHLTGYQAYDPSNPCRDCWPFFGQPYEGALTYAPWDSPEDVTSDAQNLQRPLPGGSSRPAPRIPSASSRPMSHPQHSSYAGLGHPPGSLPPSDWSRSPTSLRPAFTITAGNRPSYPGRPSGSVSYAGRPPPGSVIVRPGDPRIGGRVCWKCSGDGWQYKSLGLETKTCSACNGLGRLF